MRRQIIAGAGCSMIRFVAPSLVAVALTAGLLAAGGHDSPAQAVRTRTIYVTVTDNKRQPVEGLTPADFVVKEGGKEQSVVSVEPATKRMTITVLVSDEGSGLFRVPLAHFVQRLQAKAEFALYSVVAQGQRVVDFTSEAQALSAGLLRLGPRDRTPGGQLLPAISDAIVELQKREAARPIVLVLAVGGVEHTSMRADEVLDQLRKSRATMHVVAVSSGALRTPAAGLAAPSPTDAMSVQREQLAESERSEGATELNRVLDAGPSQSGGRHQQIVTATALLTTLQQAADELPNQYVITYALPDGAKPSDRLAVSLKRKGLTLRAPTRLPN